MASFNKVLTKKELLFITLLCHLAIIFTVASTIDGEVLIVRKYTVLFEPCTIMVLTYFALMGTTPERVAKVIRWINVLIVITLVFTWAIDLFFAQGHHIRSQK